MDAVVYELNLIREMLTTIASASVVSAAALLLVSIRKW